MEVLAPARGISVESDIPETLTARGDARRVSLILQNLAENAAKYAGEGGRVRIAAAAANGSGCVHVSNTGPPIPPESRDRLFDRFFRAGAGENISGHGLGLNIARGLARAMHGDVTLVRSDNHGTEFQLRLPGSTNPEPVEELGG
jgi:two-component system OmpR family sensor kinase